MSSRHLLWFGILAALLCLARVGFAQGRSEGVSVRLVSPLLTECAPSEIVTFSFRVANESTREEEFIESVSAPEGWQLLLLTASFSLAPAGDAIRLVAVQIPPGSSAGRYQVAYAVRSQRDYAIQDMAFAEVVVRSVASIGLMVEAKPTRVLAGQSYEAKVRVINQGNAAVEALLEVQGEEGNPASISPARLSLDANASALATVLVKTDLERKLPSPNVVLVRARSTDGKAQADLSLSVEVIPRVVARVDLVQRVPSRLTLRHVGQEGERGMQFEVSGQGALDEEGRRMVDFLLRGPDAQEQGIFGLRDEYRLNYFTEHWDLRLGDQSYGISPLLEYYRYGRGLEFAARPRPGTEWRAYLLGGRFDLLDSEAAAYFSTGLAERAHLKLNFLDRDLDLADPGGTARDRLWSIEAMLRPQQAMDLHLEYAHGDSDREESLRDEAYRVEWRGKLSPGSYFSLIKTLARPNFFGYYHDTDSTIGTLTFPLGERLHGTASFQRWRRNLDLRPERVTAPWEHIHEYGISYDLGPRRYLSLGWHDVQRRDDLSPETLHYHERPFTLSLGQAGANYSARLELRSGQQHDLAEGRSERVRYYRWFLYYRPSHRFTMTAYAGVGNRDALPGSYLLGARDSSGITFRYCPNERLRVNLGYLRSDSPASHRDTLQELSADYTLPDGRAWTLRARANAGRAGAEVTSYALEYTIPFRLPGERKRSVGAIVGRVYDAHDPLRPGVPDVIVMVGDTVALTDSVGRFAFPALPPGAHALSLDSASIGLDRVPVGQFPLQVEVRGGESTSVEIGVAAACRVSGTVMIYPYESNGNGNGAGDGLVLDDGRQASVVGDLSAGDGNGHHNGNGNGGQAVTIPTGLGNVLVELSCGEEVIRTLTDDRGRFSFDHLHPGRWRIKAYDYHLPPHHYLENPEQELTLQAADSVEANFRVLPRQRQIIVIEEGALSVKGAPREPSSGARGANK